MNKNAVENETTKSSKRGHDEPAAELAKLKQAGTTIGDEVTAYVKKQPFASVGIAVGAGFVLGSVFGSRLGRMALLAAVGYAAQNLLEGAFGEGGVRKILVDELSKRAREDKGHRHAS
jgi:hypothetical protein